MNPYYAVVWIDHHTARVLRFDGQSAEETTMHIHRHTTSQHGSGVRSEHEFFGAVCDSLAGIAEVLMTGSRTALADLRHYVDKHQPMAARRVAGYEVVDHPSDRELVAQARVFFDRREAMVGVPTAHHKPAG